MEIIFDHVLQFIDIAIFFLLVILLLYLASLRARLTNMRKMHAKMQADVTDFVRHSAKLQSSLEAIQNNIHTRSRELDKMLSLSEVTIQIMDKKINKISEMNKN